MKEQPLYDVEKISKERFVKEWQHFCTRLNLKDSYLDAEAIQFMNNFERLFSKFKEE